MIKKYKQLFRMQLSENKFLLISRTPDGKISMAQQIKIVDEHGKISYFIIKNAFLFFTDEKFNIFREALHELDIGNEINKEQIEIPYKI